MNVVTELASRSSPRANGIDSRFASIPVFSRTSSGYNLRLANDSEEVASAQRLRYEVFNLELNEGLEASHLTGLDADPFDAVCKHLIVEHCATRQVVGTYRMQTGATALKHLGYYCSQEFEFDVFESFRNEIIELGRACIRADHRNLTVLGMLWKGIADFTRFNQARYLVGCSSLTTQDPAIGAAAYAHLYRRHLSPPAWRTVPRRAFECPLHALTPETPNIPKLLRAYLSLGATICGPPALDTRFKTIDFLTLLDLHSLPKVVRTRFFG